MKKKHSFVKPRAILHTISVVLIALTGFSTNTEKSLAADAYYGTTTGYPTTAPQAPNDTSTPVATDSLGWSSPSAPTYQQLPAAPASQSFSEAVNSGTVPPDVAMRDFCNRFMESTWYTRVDYFNWREVYNGADFVNEYGTLITIGYMKRLGRERFHGAVFGATMDYVGQTQDGVDLRSATGYIGVLGEYDLHFEPESWTKTSIFVGLGSRFWVRDIKDSTDARGRYVYGYQEDWWSFYPYLGIENKHSLDKEWEFFYSGRIGCTAFTYQYGTYSGVALYPKASLMGDLEGGVRGRHVLFSAYVQTMNWEQSDVVSGWLQPRSTMFTMGLKAGFSF